MAEPKVRFKRDDGSSYPAWREYSISDLFTKIGDKNKDGQNTNVITNSAEFGLIPQRDYFDKDIAVEGNTGNYTIIQTGDFVYNPRKSSYAPMGPFNCYRLEEDGIVSPLYSCLRPKDVLNPEYLLWYFQTDKWYGYVNDHGAQNGARHDRVGMTDKILMGIPVTAPCEEEQQKIADFLSSVDDVISSGEQEVANLETQKKAVMKKIFSQEVRFRREDGSNFPEWEEKQIINIAPLQRGFDLPASELQEGSYPVVYSNGIGAYHSEYKCEGDAVITGRSGTTGSFTYLKNCKYWPHNTSLWVTDFCGNDSFFIFYWYQSINVSQYSTGTGVPTLNRNNIHEAFSFIPKSIDEQRLIADFLSDFDEAIAAAKKELELWKELKKGLLQQMFV